MITSLKISFHHVHKKHLFILIIISVVFSIQEILTRLIFPIPEVRGFNRADYSPLWLEGIEDTNTTHVRQAIRNKRYLVQSEPDGIEYNHTTNLYGFRDSQWQVSGKDGHRILFIGDSTIEGMMAPDHETIPWTFNKLASDHNQNIEVFNLGVAAAGITEYTRLVTDATQALKPDEIILVLFANDFFGINPFSEFEKNNNSLKQSKNAAVINASCLPRIFYVITELTKGHSVPLSWHGTPEKFFKAVPHPANPWSSAGDKYSEFIDSQIANAMKNGTFNPFLVNRINKIARIRKIVDTDIKEYLKFIHDFLIENKVAFSIVYLPDAEMISDYYLAYRQSYNRSKNVPSMTGKEYQVQAVYLEKLLAQLGIPFLDLSGNLKNQEDRGKRLFWNYDMHMRPEGYKFAANIIYEWWSSIAYNNASSGTTGYYLDGFDHWYIFSNQGKSLNEVTIKLDNDGDLDVYMNKASDPVNPGTSEIYPYVGIGHNFNVDITPLDLTMFDSLKLTYTLSGPMSMLISQSGIKPGEEFRIDLDEQSMYECIILSWADFHQPAWVKIPGKIDRTRITGIKFQITTPDSQQANLGIRSLVFSRSVNEMQVPCLSIDSGNV